MQIIIQPLLHSPDADCPHITRFEPYHFLVLGSAVQTRAVTQLLLLAVTAAAAWAVRARGYMTCNPEAR
jgi:hypothetical protein